MPFLSILFAYLISRHVAVVGKCLHQDSWMTAVLNKLAMSWPKSPMAFFLVPVAGSLLVLVVLWGVSFWPSFFLGILLLLFSFGRGDWRGSVNGLGKRFHEGQAENIWLMLESEGFVSGGEGEPGQGFWLAWCRYAGSRYLDALFAVFFWFFLLGPVAAVFYRLVSIYNAHPQVAAGNLPAFRQCQSALEWLPVRYMALCCCLAGNFTTGFHICKQFVLDTRLSSADVLARCLDASLVQENPADLPPDVDESLRLVMMRSPALQALLERTEIIGLVGLALAILVFH